MWIFKADESVNILNDILFLNVSILKHINNN